MTRKTLISSSVAALAISLRKAIAEHKLPAGYNVKYDGQINTLSAGADEEAALARVVNG